MKKTVIRYIAWGLAIILLLFAEVILKRLGVEPALWPTIISGSIFFLCFAPWALDMALSARRTWKQNWPEKRTQLYKAWEEPWSVGTRQLVGVLVAVELLISLYITFTTNGSILFKASQFLVAVTTVNTVLFFLWLSISSAEIEASEKVMRSKQ